MREGLDKTPVRTIADCPMNLVGVRDAYHRLCSSSEAKGAEMGDAGAELVGEFANRVGVPPLTSAEIESVLALASAAAHGTGDRTSAPLVSFLAGIAVANAGDRVAALAEARRTVAELAPESEVGQR